MHRWWTEASNLSSWVTGFGLTVACFAFFATTFRIHARTNSECVVSLGLFGLWWTSHTLEVAIVAFV